MNMSERTEKKSKKNAKAKLAPEGAIVRGVRYEGQFFKTKMCAFWEKGQCTRGADCKYAHGGKEMNVMPNLTKTSLCKELLATGTCTMENCLFAHQIEDLRATQKFFKTSMCSFYRVGQCRLGDDCRHAHDVSELRAPIDDEALTPAAPRSLGRRGAGGGLGPRVKHQSKQQKDMMDDDLNDNLVTWERTTTSPATFGATFGGNFGATFGATWPTNAPTPLLAGPQNSGKPSLPSWNVTGGFMPAPAGNCGTDEEDDDFDFKGSMWERMQTMPAPSQFAVLNSRGNDWEQGFPLVGTKSGVMAQSNLASMGLHHLWSRQKSGGGKQMEPEHGYPVQGQGGKQPVIMVPYVLVPVPVGGPVPVEGRLDQMPMAPHTQAPAHNLPMSATKEMCSRLEAQLLESAMPEVYED